MGVSLHEIKKYVKPTWNENADTEDTFCEHDTISDDYELRMCTLDYL